MYERTASDVITSNQIKLTILTD